MLKLDRTESDYSQTIEESIPKLKLLGFEDFQASIPGYEDPAAFSFVGDEDELTPDIVARRKGAKAYFEIARKTEHLSRLVTKWKLLSRSAALKEGFFGIITPRGTIRFTQEVLSNYNIRAQIIRI